MISMWANNNSRTTILRKHKQNRIRKHWFSPCCQPKRSSSFTPSYHTNNNNDSAITDEPPALQLQHHHHLERIHAAKKRVRPDWSLSQQWSQNGYAAATRRSASQWPAPRRGMTDLLPVTMMMTMDRSMTTSSSSSSTMLDLAQPARLQYDLSTAWPYVEAFSLPNLLQHYGTVELCVGSSDDDDDDIVTLQLQDYLAYAMRDADADDSPLYVFDDWILLLDDDATSLKNSYAVPSCFPDDYLSLLDDDERPPYCWLLVGAARSGTALHVDPMGTAAWNTLVRGAKRWFLFPPKNCTTTCDDYLSENSTTSSGSGGVISPTAPITDSAIHWLMEEYPTMPSEQLEGGLDFVQRPGETVYVPPGWRHAVVNLPDDDDQWNGVSVAVTHNFVGPHNVRAALESMRRDDDDDSDSGDQTNEVEPTSSSSSLSMADAWEEQLRKRGWLEG